ncbi:MAG: NAD(P)H-dependent oxidoreductase [Raoultibacter sp.]
MPMTLFVNACMRGEMSRTLTLCREYLEGKTDVVEVDLDTLGLLPLDGKTAGDRFKLQQAGAWDDPVFDLAKQFATADEIVIGVPYWDLSFPAAFKAYIEQVSVCDIAFHYEGICMADSITYVTTCGGFVGDMNFGYEYMQGIATMFGIPETNLIIAEGLDIVGIDVDAQMDKARATIAQLKG